MVDTETVQVKLWDTEVEIEQKTVLIASKEAKNPQTVAAQRLHGCILFINTAQTKTISSDKSKLVVFLNH